VWRELKTPHPVVDLRALKERSFSTGVFIISLLGFVLYASLVLLPIYVQTLLNYPAYQAGLALSPRGVGALLTTPLAGYLTSKIDPRKLLIFGLVIGSLTMFQLSHLNLNAGMNDIIWPQVLQGIGLSFLFIPLMASSMARISKEGMGNATSIFNLMRNIGGSFGIAIMTTFLTRRAQFHQNHLVENIHPGNLRLQEMLAGMQAWFHSAGADKYTASRKALAAVYGLVQRHAAMLSFVEAFWIMGLVFLLIIPLIFLLRNPIKEHATEKASEPATKPASQVQEEEEQILLVH
jgi:DHA2 family multidrug resistance protein